MGSTKNQKGEIQEVLKQVLRNKFQNYKRETTSMPFHTRLLGKDRYALFSFIHSLNTTFGTSIFEPVAIALARGQFKRAEKQMKSGTQISTAALFEIQKIMDELTAANSKRNRNYSQGLSKGRNAKSKTHRC